jgi:hypothetical protein
MPILGIIASSFRSAAGPVGAYDALATVTVPSGGLASITFAGIPTGYKHLQIRAMNILSSNVNTTMRFNGDTGSNYSQHNVYGYGTGVAAEGAANQSSMDLGYAAGGSYPTAMVIDILDYADTNKYKTTRHLFGNDTNSTSAGRVGLFSNSWRSTSAVTTILIYPDSGTISQYSSFALYGIK